MLTVGKSLAWIITSIVGLVAGIGAVVFNTSASAGTATNGLSWPPHWPPHWPPQHGPPPAVPEVNTGLVLLPIVLAILLFTWRHLLRRRALQNR
jgi:H+/Cl- antiporter ClcA